MARSICTIEGCDRLVNGHGFCDKHYQRWAKHGSPFGGSRNHAPDQERFWRYVDKKEPDECWLWTARKQPNGYGRFQVGGKGGPHKLAHRLSFEYANKRPPAKGLVVMHACDNPACVNPSHLSEGTYRENTEDMVRKGRNCFHVTYGEDSGVAKLNDNAVREIRATEGVTNASLGRKFGVSPSTIKAVRKGTTWTHVN